MYREGEASHKAERLLLLCLLASKAAILLTHPPQFSGGSHLRAPSPSEAATSCRQALLR